MKSTSDTRYNQRIHVDFSNMIAENIGARGIPESDFTQAMIDLQYAVSQTDSKRDEMKWRDLHSSQDAVLCDVKRIASRVRDHFDTFVVLGIGGSALGPIAVHQALNHLHYNDLPHDKRNGPRLFVEDNVDPQRMSDLLDVIDPRKTAFNVISKSGSTSETMAQLLIILDLLKKTVGEGWVSHIIATTDKNKGNLIKAAQQYGDRKSVV